MAQIVEPKEDAVLEVQYTKKWSIDTITGKYYVDSPMILRIGETSSMFYPVKRMRIDSLNYYEDHAGSDLILDGMLKGINPTKISGWEEEYLFRNVTDNETFVCKRYSIYHIGYKETTELPQWTIHPDSIRQILGYECIYATTTFHGRDWEAWFTPELPYNEGPWKLAGLPGVVLSAQDSRGQYLYEASAIRDGHPHKVGIFIYESRPLELLKSREDYLRSVYYLQLKRKAQNLVSLYTDFKTLPTDEAPLYDLQEIDFPH